MCNQFYLILLIFINGTVAAESISEIWNEGVTHYKQGDLQQALDNFTRVLDVAPHNVQALYTVGNIQRRLNNLDQAINLLERGLKLSPTNSDIGFALGQAYLAAGDNEQGWSHFNQFRTAEVLKKIPQKLDDLYNKTVVITAEWGLGDCIHFIRYAQLLKHYRCTVIAQCHRSLVPLLKTCPYIDVVAGQTKELPAHAYEIPLLYLPTLFKTTNTTIPAPVPYLLVPTQLKQKYQPLLSTNSKFKIGICWDIGHNDTNFVGWKRAAPLEKWLPLAALHDVSFYSLQKDATAQLRAIQPQWQIHDFGLSFDTAEGAFMDSAAVMQHLDLVITVDTAIAHLAGALGVRTWVLLPYSPDYRWTLSGSTTPWYPTMRLFRQTKPGSWHEPIQEIVAQLKQHYAL